MKILIAPGHYLFSEKYGSEPSWICYLVKHLAEHVETIDVLVGVVDSSIKYPSNVNIIPLFKNRSKSLAVESLRRLLFYVLVTLKALRMLKNDYDVIHHYLPLSTATYNPLFAIIKLLKIKTKTVIGPMQLAQLSNPDTDLGVVLTGKPSKNTIINGLYKSVIGLHQQAFKTMTDKTDLFLFNSKTAKQYYLKKYKFNKTAVLESGIEESVWDQRKHINKRNIIKILSVGQLTSRKGHALLIEALRIVINKNKNVHLTIVGDGEEYSALTELTKRLQLADYVTFLGRVPHDQINNIYKKHDIFCHTPTSDPSPTVILEAMYSFLPVITVDVGSIKEMVGTAGMVVKNSSYEIAAAISSLVSSTDKRNILGTKAHERIQNNYLWPKIAKKLLSMYN